MRPPATQRKADRDLRGEAGSHQPKTVPQSISSVAIIEFARLLARAAARDAVNENAQRPLSTEPSTSTKGTQPCP
jgi:hypothetical protein